MRVVDGVEGCVEQIRYHGEVTKEVQYSLLMTQKNLSDEKREITE
jgi:hypothetical protein